MGGGVSMPMANRPVYNIYTDCAVGRADEPGKSEIGVVDRSRVHTYMMLPIYVPTGKTIAFV